MTNATGAKVHINGDILQKLEKIRPSFLTRTAHINTILQLAVEQKKERHDS